MLPSLSDQSLACSVLPDDCSLSIHAVPNQICRRAVTCQPDTYITHIDLQAVMLFTLHYWKLTPKSKLVVSYAGVLCKCAWKIYGNQETIDVNSFVFDHIFICTYVEYYRFQYMYALM